MNKIKTYGQLAWDIRDEIVAVQHRHEIVDHVDGEIVNGTNSGFCQELDERDASGDHIIVTLSGECALRVDDDVYLADDVHGVIEQIRHDGKIVIRAFTS